MIPKDVISIIDEIIHKAYIDELNREYHSLFMPGTMNDFVYYRKHYCYGVACNYRLLDRSPGWSWSHNIYRIVVHNEIPWKSIYTEYNVPKNY